MFFTNPFDHRLLVPTKDFLCWGCRQCRYDTARHRRENRTNDM